MKVLKYMGIAVLAFIVFFMGVVLLTGKNEHYNLAMVNSGPNPAEISVNLSEETWTLQPGEVKTVKVDGQKQDDIKIERNFSIKVGDNTNSVKGLVDHYNSTVLLDVTGTSCVVAVDHGPQYRPESVKLPEGESDTIIKEKYTGKNFHNIEPYIGTPLGEPLPDNIKISYSGMPKHIRLIHVPCNLMNDSVALYKFLNSN